MKNKKVHTKQTAWNRLRTIAQHRTQINCVKLQIKEVETDVKSIAIWCR